MKAAVTYNWTCSSFVVFWLLLCFSLVSFSINLKKIYLLILVFSCTRKRPPYSFQSVSGNKRPIASYWFHNACFHSFSTWIWTMESIFSTSSAVVAVYKCRKFFQPCVLCAASCLFNCLARRPFTL